MITVKGVQLNFNFMNADHIQKWEDARKEVSSRYKDISDADMRNIGLQGYADLLRRACNSIFDLFDGIFGDGTSNDLFGSECDFEECIDAFGEFEAAIADQANNFGDKVKKYTPVGPKGKGK